MTVADLRRNLSIFNKEIDNIFFVADSRFHVIVQQEETCYSDMDETLKEFLRNNFASDLLETMFSRENGTISVELVIKQYRKS